MSNILNFLKNNKKEAALEEFTLVYENFAETPTPEIIAELFASLDSKEQARFYNHIHEVASQWHGGFGSFSMQLQYITEEEGLTLGGRQVMQFIGDYSHWGLTMIDSKNSKVEKSANFCGND